MYEINNISVALLFYACTKNECFTRHHVASNVMLLSFNVFFCCLVVLLLLFQMILLFINAIFRIPVVQLAIPEIMWDNLGSDHLGDDLGIISGSGIL